MWGRFWEGELGFTAFLLQLAEPFILPLQRGWSKSKGDKSSRPTKDIEKSEEVGRVVGERGRGREKPWGPNKSLKPADPKDQTGRQKDRKRADRVGIRNPSAKEERE